MAVNPAHPTESMPIRALCLNWELALPELSTSWLSTIQCPLIPLWSHWSLDKLVFLLSRTPPPGSWSELEVCCFCRTHHYTAKTAWQTQPSWRQLLIFLSRLVLYCSQSHLVHQQRPQDVGQDAMLVHPCLEPALKARLILSGKPSLKLLDGCLTVATTTVSIQTPCLS